MQLIQRFLKDQGTNAIVLVSLSVHWELDSIPNSFNLFNKPVL